jgi:hypothetical protein
MYTYVTETDPAYAKKIYGIASLIAVAVCSVLGLSVLTVSFIAWLIFECVLIVVVALASKSTFAANQHYTFKFRGKSLYVFGTTISREAHFDRLKRSEIIIKQSEKDAANDRCNVKIRNNRFYGVKNAKEFIEYIDNTYVD